MRPPMNTLPEGPAFQMVWEQIKLFTGFSSQHELAQALGIADSAITDAKKRGLFPLNWAYRLAKSHHLSLDEILLLKPPATPNPSRGGCCTTCADSAVQLVEEAIAALGKQISERQKQALVDIVREELKAKAIRMVKALKE